jgi:hypothetical protein
MNFAFFLINKLFSSITLRFLIKNSLIWVCCLFLLLPVNLWAAKKTKTSFWFDPFLYQYALVDGQTSPDGNWKCAFTGYGQVKTEFLTSSDLAMKLQPQVSTDTSITHASLATSTATFSDQVISVDVRTVQQVRQGSAPNPWEVAWVFFRLTNGNNCYYFMVKPNGAELGKLINGGQVFLATTSSPKLTIGNWDHWTISALGNHITITVDGVQVIDYTDQYAAPSFSSGSVALYTEDAYVQFDNVRVETPTRPQNYTSLSDLSDGSAFAAQQYQDILNREPDTAGVEYWTAALNSGSMSREQVVLEFFKTAQLQTDSAFVDSPDYNGTMENSIFAQRIYFALLRRSATPDEINYWTDELNNGRPQLDLISTIINSPEYLSRFEQS